MVSIGPTITGPHSPDEQVHIESVGHYWTLLTELLKSIPLNKPAVRAARRGHFPSFTAP